MRSSPRFLAASRRGDDSQRSYSRKVIRIGGRHRQDEPEHEGLDIRVSVSYKTLAVIFAMFSVLGHIVDTVSSRDLSSLSEKLVDWSPFW
jgi:hypothetical protein